MPALSATHRRVVIVGVVLVVLSSLAPVRGIVVGAIGAAAIAWGIVEGHDRRRPVALAGFALVALGVGATQLGDFLGRQNDTNGPVFLQVLALAYFPGWFASIAAGLLALMGPGSRHRG